MSYLNAKDVFPPEILEVIQRYVQGASIYIPRREETKKQSKRTHTTERNLEILRKYSEGISVRRLSEEYFLSPQAIYKILSCKGK